ncbi:MAG: flagellar hook-basal body protein [Butyricicoccus sp.]|nr:flagellar hook-basal body protein [Butyricicoccus sp.]
MFKGFYNLTSGMLTQQRNLTVIADNLTNVSTAGYKESRYLASTFDDVMYNIVGNKKKEYTEIGRQSYIRANDEIYVSFDQGIPEPTDIPLDFAIYGDGFFAIEGDNGRVYTRAGSFSLDDEGYLCFPGQGRVLDSSGQAIYLGTDKITADDHGNIYTEADKSFLGQLGVYEFDDVHQLEYTDEGMFTGPDGTAADNPLVYWKYLERSNTDMVRQMTAMLTSQRSLQSAATVTKMYDEVMSHAASDVGRM